MFKGLEPSFVHGVFFSKNTIKFREGEKSPYYPKIFFPASKGENYESKTLI